MGGLLGWLAALAVFVGAPTWYALRRRHPSGRHGDDADSSSTASWRFQGSGGSR